jgi:hypothetical protein
MHKIVNLETFWIPEEEKYDLLKSEIGDADSVLGLMLADGFIHENPGPLIERISKEVDLVLVPGLAGDNTSYTKTIPFNFNLHTTYNSYKDRSTNKWNNSSTKFLFLGGVPNRPNRIGLLNKFQKAGLLNNAEWTFFKPWTTKQVEWCKQYLTTDYDSVLQLARSIDSTYESSKHYSTDPATNTWTKDTAWIEPAIFSNTAISVISEGIDSSDISSKYLTEKTYRVFVQQHPFLHASCPDMFDYIKELGFKTFEEYMLIKDYAYLPDEEDRLDAIVENTQHFLENYKTYQVEIEQDIKYNYTLFFTLALKNKIILDNIRDIFGIDQTEIDKWFNQKGFGHLVRAYD